MVLLKHLTQEALDTLFPPRCFACGGMVGGQGSLCATCWGEVDFISAPMCHRCGMPFEVDAGEGGECMPCLQNPPPYVSARAVFRYEGESRRLITGYKYYDRTQATPMFARWLARASWSVESVRSSPSSSSWDAAELRPATATCWVRRYE